MSNSSLNDPGSATGDDHNRLKCTIEHVPCGHRITYKLHPRFGLADQVRELGLPLHLEFDYDRFCPKCHKIHLPVSRRCPGEVSLVYISAILSSVENRSSSSSNGPKLLSVILDELTAHWWLELRNCEVDWCHGDEWGAVIDAWAKRSVDFLTDTDLREVYLRLKGNRLIDLGEDDQKHLPEEQANEVVEALTKSFVSMNPKRNLPWVHDLLS